MKLASIIAISCCLAALTPVAQAQDIFTFDSQPAGSFIFEATPLPPNYPIVYAPQTLTADNNPARVATFSVSGSANPAESFQFQNTPGYGTDLSGVYLANVDDDPNDVLTITFAQPITSLSLDFAIQNFTGGTTPDASLSLNGVTATGGYNATSTNFEGMLTYTGAPFTVADLTLLPGASGDNGYAIDNITVTPSAISTPVPEPGLGALGAAGLVTVAGLLRRRRK